MTHPAFGVPRARLSPLLLFAALGCGSHGEVTSEQSAALSGSGGPIVGLAGKCLDDANDSTASGNTIQLYACNGTDAQKWSWANGALVGAGGKCLDVTGASSANGTRIELWDCNGGSNQQWTSSNGQLVGIGGKCLDVRGFDSSDGADIELWDCNGGANQQWSVSVPLATPPPDPPTGPSAGLTTSDTLLRTGSAASVTYQAPTPNAAVAEVVAEGNAGDILWKLVPDAYGIASGAGSIEMTYGGNGSITTNVNLSGLNLTNVAGYPFIGYGADVFGYSSNGQAPQFPAMLSSMSSLIFDTSYTLAGTFSGNIDVLFDEWLTPSPTYAGGQGGAVEVEILPYYSFGSGLFGTFLQTFPVAVTLNGVDTTMSFSEYSSVPGPGPGSIILFYPASGTGLMSGELSFDALTFLDEAARATGVSTSWYTPGFDLGTEFGQSATENFSFTVTKVGITQTPAD